MKVEVEINEWWEVHYVEEVEQYNQRERETYTSKQPGVKVFINEGEALDFIVDIKKNMAFSHIVVKQCKEVQK